jgi:hypothetical protein
VLKGCEILRGIGLDFICTEKEIMDHFFLLLFRCDGDLPQERTQLRSKCAVIPASTIELSNSVGGVNDRRECNRSREQALLLGAGRTDDDSQRDRGDDPNNDKKEKERDHRLPNVKDEPRSPRLMVIVERWEELRNTDSGERWLWRLVRPFSFFGGQL